MPSPPVLYYITDRTQFSGDEPSRRRRLLEKIAEATRCAVDYIQLREKDLPTRDLETLAREAVDVVRQSSNRRNAGPEPPITRLLINSRTDVALAVEADGVHLRSDDISPATARRVCSLASARNQNHETRSLIVGVSCHSPSEVARAAADGADFAVFAPVFEKKGVPAARATGLQALQQACQFHIPVFALGGVTLANAPACLQAGAAGIAAIRLFQENEIARVIQALRPSPQS